MSLSEILDNGVSHPWANIRVNSINSEEGITIVDKASYTQATNPTTAVFITGEETAFRITTQSFTTASAGQTNFSVSNLAVTTDSYVFINWVYNGVPFTAGAPHVEISNITNGSFQMNVKNYGSNALSGTFVIYCLVI